MKITKKNLTLSNVKAFIQANSRMLTEAYGPEFLKSPQYIQEQVTWRPLIANPDCIEAGECVDCHCDIPDKFYSDKGCDSGCYPEILSEEDWEEFKRIKEQNGLDDRVWEDIIRIIELKKFNDMTTTHDVGKIKKGTIHHFVFPLFNPLDDTFTINVINVSCSCVNTSIPDPAKPRQPFSIPTSINTKNKIVGKHAVWLTVRYNKIKRVNLEIQFEVID